MSPKRSPHPLSEERSQPYTPSQPPHLENSANPFVNSNTGVANLVTKATRRIRGEIACAECRRLKIRCDRLVPCSTCIKRGCSALCPNGTIPPGDGSRFVLAATEHLHRKMTRMEARMHSLEDALAIIQAGTSDKPHPLLTTPFEDVDEEPKLMGISEEQSKPASDFVDSLGTLIIDDHGSSRFFGKTGGSESLLVKAKELEEQTLGKPDHHLLEELDPSYLPAEINQYYHAFPFAPPGVRNAVVQPMIESFLPGMERAITLCDTFLEHLSWMFHIVSRQYLVAELIPAIYKRKPTSYGPHDLALLLIVLGVGSLVDLELRPYNLEAQHYYRLAKAALGLQPILTEQSVVTIKVLHLMSIYYGMSGKESNLEPSYNFLDLAGQVALGIGFHIDPSMWGIGTREAYERRVYFWNLMAAVLWQSLVTGRPPGLLTSFVSCQIPSAEDERLFQEGEVPLGFGIWGFRASVECLIPLVKAILAAKPPDYSTILELEAKIRNFVLPQQDSTQDDRTALSMRTFVRSHYQDLMLLFLHRAFFAQAMTENPANPMESKYSHSVYAAYSSACVVLRDTRSQFAKKPLLCARVWRIWSLAFSAAVIVGTIAIRGLQLGFEPQPLREFELACATFKEAALTSNRAARAMPVLDIMLQKALEAQRRHTHNPGQVPTDGSTDDDELSIFGGQTRVYNTQENVQRVLSASAPPQPQSHQSAMSTDPSLPIPSPRREHQPHPKSEMVQLSQPQFQPFQQPSSQIPEQLLPPQQVERTGAGYSNASLNVQHNQLFDDYGVPMKTFADLSGGWGGMFHEVTGSYGQQMPSLTPQSYQTPIGEGGMLDDRWSSFMHHYGVVSQPPMSPP